MRRLRPVVLGGGRNNTRPYPLGQDEAITRPRSALRHNLRGVGKARHAEAVLWLRVGDGVSARDNPPRLAHLVRATLEYCGQYRLVQVSGESHDIQGKGHLSAHRI